MISFINAVSLKHLMTFTNLFMAFIVMTSVECKDFSHAKDVSTKNEISE